MMTVPTQKACTALIEKRCLAIRRLRSAVSGIFNPAFDQGNLVVVPHLVRDCFCMAADDSPSLFSLFQTGCLKAVEFEHWS